MKKKQGSFFGFVVLLITAIFTLAGCGNGTTDLDYNPFVGTWLSTATDGQYRKIIMKSDLTGELHQSQTGNVDTDTIRSAHAKK
jgi:hypothetical protein